MHTRQILARLSRGLALMVAEAIVKRVDDAPRLQEVQLSVMAGETRSRLQRLQEYGLTSVPLEGARGIALFLGGNRDHGVVVASDDGRYRLKGLNPGEVALYSKFGQFIHMKDDGSLVISAPAGIKLTTPEGVEVEAKTIENHAAEKFEHSTNGYGQQWIYDVNAVTWRTDSWTLDPLAGPGQVVAGAANPVSPPEIP